MPRRLREGRSLVVVEKRAARMEQYHDLYRKYLAGDWTIMPPPLSRATECI